MLAVKNCWALIANQLNSFVQFLPLCLYLPAVAGELYCRHRSARFAPALLESPDRSPGLLKGLLLPGDSQDSTPGSILCPRQCLPVCTSAAFLVLVKGYPQFTACKVSVTMLAAFSGAEWRANGIVSHPFIFPHNFVSKNFSPKDMLSGNLRLENLHQQSTIFTW